MQKMLSLSAAALLRSIPFFLVAGQGVEFLNYPFHLLRVLHLRNLLPLQRLLARHFDAEAFVGVVLRPLLGLFVLAAKLPILMH